MTTDQTTRPTRSSGPGTRAPSRFDLSAFELPAPELPAFDLPAFGRALTTGDLGDQLARYAADAEIRITTDTRTTPPRVVSGTRAIWAWLHECSSADPPSVVSRLVDGGERVAFSQRWRDPDGTTVLLVSTADLQDGLITRQHTILTRSEDRRSSNPGG
jgi:hypothetical protein